MAIITHTGKAHVDDFLASCVCLFKLNKKLIRVNSTDEMLKDPEFWVLDQGLKYEPSLHNFDHHHLNEEICSFTMVLDYFYGKNYREYMPNLRFIEIYDSFGSGKASEFIGMKQNKLELITSPIQSSILRSFSKIEGVVEGFFLEIMRQIGAEICENIEKTEKLLKILDNFAYFFEFNEIKILDLTRCDSPYPHDQLPTKTWCKIKKIYPSIILTKDSREKNTYRMISVNREGLQFLPNEKSSFTHISGFLTSFKNYNDYQEILSKYIK